MNTLTLIAWYAGIALEFAAAARLSGYPRAWLAAMLARDLGLVLLAHQWPSLYRPAWILTSPVVTFLLLAAAVEMLRLDRAGILAPAAAMLTVCIAIPALHGIGGRDLVMQCRVIADLIIIAAVVATAAWFSRLSLHAGALLAWVGVEAAAYLAIGDHLAGQRWINSGVLMTGQAIALAGFIVRRRA